MADKIACKDLYLGAFLRSQGIPMIDIERRANHSIFYFEESEKARELIDLYIRDKATASVIALRNSLRDLKSLVSGDIPMPGN